MFTWDFFLCLGIFVLAGDPPSVNQDPPSEQKVQTAASTLSRADMDRLEQKWLNALVAQKNDFDRRLLHIEVLFAVSVGLFGLNFLFLFLGLRNLERRNINRVEKRLAELTDRKGALVQNLFNELDLEQKVKKEWSILLLANQGDFENLERLEGLGFKRVFPKEFSDLSWLEGKGFSDLKEGRFDLVVFDKLDQERIEGFLAKSKKSVFVGYSPTRVRLDSVTQQKINFANSPMTLYARIMEAARYQNAHQQLNHRATGS